jgi:anti-sigma regulatory factor (Ser/Thr protein kinase)
MSISMRSVGLVGLSLVGACYSADANDPTAEGDVEGVSARLAANLTVAGHYCPTSGEIAGRTRPADGQYYVTTFGGGGDTQRMSCGGTADGRWLYIADSWRFGCGSRVKVTNPRTGRWCVTQVADIGPNICVERAAGKPVIDASPAVTRELFNAGAIGWSQRVLVRAELAEDLPQLWGREGAIRGVLMNLCMNAVQAMANGGQLTVRTLRLGEDRVLLEIEDDGPGIAPDHLNRIWDPFFTTKPVGQGTGLGLSITQRIVSSHGGRIRVTSEPGNGARFTVTLPTQGSGGESV